MNACPCCGRAGEMGIHLLECASEEMKESKLLAERQLHELMKALRAVMAGESPLIHLDRGVVERLVLVAVEEQGRIGWGNMVKGRLSKKWIQAQEPYCATHHRDFKTLSGRPWLVRAIQGF